MTYSHLRADCLYTGISSGPNAGYRVWENLYLFSICWRISPASGRIVPQTSYPGFANGRLPSTDSLTNPPPSQILAPPLHVVMTVMTSLQCQCALHRWRPLLTRCRGVTQWCFSVPPLSLAQSVSQPISSQSCAFINATDTREETIEIWETNENPKVSQFCISV